MQLGKVIGGGLPVGAYGGRKDIMQMVAPAGVFHFPFFNLEACCKNGLNETVQHKHFHMHYLQVHRPQIMLQHPPRRARSQRMYFARVPQLVGMDTYTF